MRAKVLKLMIPALAVLGVEVPSFGSTDLVKSGTSLGYAVENSPYKGFSNIGGSRLAFDLVYQFADDIGVGLHSQGGGGHDGSRSFYRLCSGPTVTYQLWEKFRLAATLTYFKESVSVSGDDVLATSGMGTQISWQRVLYAYHRLTLTGGGFYAHFWGKSRRESQQAVIAPGTTWASSKGLEIALQIDL
jgi:hypothetical protein